MRLLHTPWIPFKNRGAFQADTGGAPSPTARDCGVEKRPTKRMMILLLLGIILAILITRGFTLMHEATLHPDEKHFFLSSQSLAQKILTPASTYTVSKVYPEGAFVLQAPFHMLDLLLCKLTNATPQPRLYGRIASLVFFAGGVLLGALLLCRYWQATVGCVAIYGLLMCFSLFQIEQSRYGTGDPPSFLMMMALLYALFAYFASGKARWIVLAGLASGALGAIKYPQIYFVLLPVAAVLLDRQRGKSRKHLLLLMLTVAAGFLALSPSELANPEYIPTAIQREANAYIVGGGSVTSPLGNLWAIAAYHLLYSDVPLSPVLIAVACLYFLRQSKGSRSPAAIFQAVVIPAVFLIFLLYNLFAKKVVLRTLYTYYSVGILYAAFGMYRSMRRKAMRIGILALCLVMVARSAVFLTVLAEPSRSAALLSTITQSEGWATRNRTLLLGGGYLTGNAQIPEPVESVALEQIMDAGFPEMQPGDVTVTAPFEYYFTHGSLAPILNERLARLTANWEQYKKDNQAYYIGQPYEAWMYVLFGYQLHISTGALFEMPANAIYTRGYD